VSAAEEWRAIQGLPGYEVSDVGRVRSPRKVLSPWTCNGYQQIAFSVGGVRHSNYVHRLVLEAFVGPCPEGLETRHLDGDRTNNELANLVWGTPAEQVADKIRHGSIERQRQKILGRPRPENRGTKHHLAKLNEEAVRAIRASSEPGAELARRYGVSPALICHVRKGRSWSWLHQDAHLQSPPAAGPQRSPATPTPLGRANTRGGAVALDEAHS
jgi:hypothetical protein